MDVHGLVVVTAADTGFMEFLRGMVASLRALPGAEAIPIRVLDLGLTPADRAWLAERGTEFATPHPHLGAPADTPARLLGFLARPYLRDYFPGFTTYFWVDGDAWLQRPEAIEGYVAGARASGLAVASERERGYRFQAWLQAWTAKHMLLGFGPADAAWLMTRPHLNAGVFALRDTAPQWAGWAAAYARAYARSGALVPHDQFALNRLVSGGLLDRVRAPATILPARDNWICDRGPPMWNDAERAFCEPYPPYRPLNVLHLAGPAKRGTYPIRRTGGGTFEARLVHGAAPPA